MIAWAKFRQKNSLLFMLASRMGAHRLLSAHPAQKCKRRWSGCTGCAQSVAHPSTGNSCTKGAQIFSQASPSPSKILQQSRPAFTPPFPIPLPSTTLVVLETLFTPFNKHHACFNGRRRPSSIIVVSSLDVLNLEDASMRRRWWRRDARQVTLFPPPPLSSAHG